MVKKVLLFGLAGMFVFSLSGCATMRKSNDLEVQGLRNHVLALESQLREKDDEINSLKEAPVKGSEEVAVSSEQLADPKDVQTALKNAGFYKGKIDGVKGRNTKKAIKEFQKANGLRADGVVGSKTWELLSKYENGSAQAATGTEEGASTK